MKTNQSTFRTIVALGAGAALTLAACGGDDDAADATTPSTESTAEVSADEVPTGPSTLTLADQDGDGTTVTIDAVDLPAAGFVAVHSGADGSPGPVIGVSELLNAGSTTDVVVTLDEPLTETGTVFPMVHIDTDANGVYEFGTVDGVDGPGVTAAGDVAVGPVVVTLATGGESSAAAPPTQPASITFTDQDSDGAGIVIASVELPAAGFVAVHSDGGGSPGPVIGVSELLPAGTSTDVAITLDEPLSADSVLFPMVHIDTNTNGVYEFGSVEGVDGPGVTAGGDVAVVGATVSVDGSEAATSADDAITIADFAFSGVTEVPIGTTVVVTNTDATPHTWTAEDGTFDSGAISPDDTFEFTFTTAGEFAYFCNFHPSMTGTIVVTG
jgi:plastocyanin